MVEKARLTRCCSVNKDQNVMDLSFPVISSNRHIIEIPQPQLHAVQVSSLSIKNVQFYYMKVYVA